MRRVRRALGAAALALVFAGATPGVAQERVATGRSGQPIIVGVVIDCTDHYLPSSASAAASHGTVAAEQRKIPACGKSDELAWIFTYTSEPGYRGDDGVTMYLGGGSFFRRVTVQ
ncbi:MAG: hypothetical protein U1E56_02085 [Bauldia sp.]